MSGYSKSRFVDLTDSDFDELMCGICFGVFRDPIETNCCRKTFCTHCINEWIAKNNTCPNDRKRLTRNDLIGSSKIVLNLLAKLTIKCEFNDNGCPKLVLLDSLHKHIDECNYNKCKNCGESMRNDHNCEHSLKIRVNQLSSNNGLINKRIQQMNAKIIKMESVLRKRNIIICYKCGEEGHFANKCNDKPSSSAQTIFEDASGVRGKPHQRARRGRGGKSGRGGKDESHKAPQSSVADNARDKPNDQSVPLEKTDKKFSIHCLEIDKFSHTFPNDVKVGENSSKMHNKCEGSGDLVLTDENSINCKFCHLNIMYTDIHAHMELKHRQRLCPICSMLFDLNVTGVEVYLQMHVENHLDIENSVHYPTQESIPIPSEQIVEQKISKPVVQTKQTPDKVFSRFLKKLF